MSEWIEDSRTGDFKTKAAAQDAPGIPPNEQRNTGVATLYVQHPGSARMTGSAVIPGNSFTPVVLSDTAAWVYDQCREHRTAASLVSDRADQMSGPGARIESLVRELVQHGMLVEIPPGSLLPLDIHATTRHLLWEAHQRMEAGQWAEAEKLCREASVDAALAAAAELNLLIARYHAGKFEGMVEHACLLSARMTPPAQTSCDALALLVAHRTEDRATAKRVALFLSRRFPSHWDLPTVPASAVWVRGSVLVIESKSVEPMLAVIDELVASGVGTAEEMSAIESLAGRYRERQAHMKAQP